LPDAFTGLDPSMSISSAIGPAAAAAPAAPVDAVSLGQALGADGAAATSSIAAPNGPAKPGAPTVSAPAAALAAAVQAAAGNQGGMAALFADLGAALQSSSLPEAVADAANQLLGLQLPLEPPPTGADLSQALAQSGLFLEANLASSDGAPTPDMKSALLGLEQALEVWAGDAAPHMIAEAAAPPPYRGGPLQGQPPAQPTLPPDATMATVGAQLMQGTTRAIARTVLLQAASLPRGAKANPANRTPRLQFEIPLNTPGGAAIAPFEISRDDPRPDSEDQEPVWQAKFALHLEPMGPVQAKVALVGDRVRVTLWAERAQTAGNLAARADDLTRALAAEDLKATVKVIPAAPEAPAPSPGRLVDQAL
jgi:hypothetical protein